MIKREILKSLGLQKISFHTFIFLCVSLLFSQGAFANSALGSSLDPTSGSDPWAIFQLMVSVGTEIWYVIKVVLLISGILGLIFIILGLLKIRANALDSQSGGAHLKHGIILVILGGLLFSGPFLMEITGYSLFGSAPAPVATNGNVNCQMINGQYTQGCGTPCASGVAVQNSDGTSTCQCPAGTDQSNGCQPCPAGQGNSSSGGACAPCPTGSGSANGECVPCTGDTGVINGVCTPCSGASIGVNGTCKACTGGQGVSNGTCVTCPDNEVVSPSGACAICPQGEGKSNGACVACTQGYGSNPQDAKGFCVPCNGTNAFSQIQPGGAWVCVECPSGSNATAGSPASSSCKCSDPNATFNSTGIGSCPCNAGYFLSSSGACSQCSPGTYEISGVCTSCGPGTYAPNSGATGCINCEAGTYETGTRASACTQCAAGTYSAHVGAKSSSVCKTCANAYSSNAGASSCFYCGSNADQNAVGCQTYKYTLQVQGINPEGPCGKGCMAFGMNDYTVEIQVCPSITVAPRGCSTGFASVMPVETMNCSTSTVMATLNLTSWGCDGNPELKSCGPDPVSGMCV